VASDSSYSESSSQLRAGASALSSNSTVTGNKLQTSGNVCITLVKGSLVKQEVSISLNCTFAADILAEDNEFRYSYCYLHQEILRSVMFVCWLVVWFIRSLVCQFVNVYCRQISRKQLEIEARFQWTTSRKWLMANQMVT